MKESSWILNQYKTLTGSRGNFDSYYQVLHDYYMIEGEDITTGSVDGSELRISKLMDSTSLTSVDVLASGLMNYLTPQSSKWLYLEHSDAFLKGNKAITDWFQEVTDIVIDVLAKSNFYNQINDFYKTGAVYGTAYLRLEEDEEDDVRFSNIDLKACYIIEDARERPFEYFLRQEYTAEQAYSRWGDDCNDEIKSSYKSTRNPDKKYEFVCYFGLNDNYNPDKDTKEFFKYIMNWVDCKSKEIIEIGYFRSMPILAHRFYKRHGCAYGFSPAMKALPFVRLLNTIADTTLRADMKATSPAWMLPDNAFLAPLNQNPNAINYYRKGSLDPSKDIAPLNSGGQVSMGQWAIEYYSKKIEEIMFKDVFLAFQDITKQMTVPEVMERVSEKMTLLAPAVSRYLSDVLQPIITRVVDILATKGKLPPIPEMMMVNPNYEVKFVSRLVMAQRSQEINNIVSALGIVGNIAGAIPDVIDKIDGDAIVDEIWKINGIDVDLLRDEAQVKSIREGRKQQQEMMMMMQAGKDITQMEKDVNEINKPK